MFTVFSSYADRGDRPLLTKTFTKTATGWDKADFGGAYFYVSDDYGDEVHDTR
jgi:hypothetical protein